MKIAEITITDTYGCQHAKFSPRTWTWVRGHNGSGKSSILRALGYVFEGGSDPGVIRKGSDASRIEMRLDDGTVITKVTKAKRKGGGYTTELEVLQPDGTPRPAPKTFIDELSRHLAVDPSVLLRIDATTVPGRKQLAAELMRLIPIVFAPEEIAKAFTSGYTIPAQAAMVAQRGPDGKPLRDDSGKILMTETVLPEEQRAGLGETPIPTEFAGRSLTLDDVKKLSVAMTEQRRRIGQVRDDSEGAVRRLLGSLPENDNTDHAAVLAKLEGRRKEIEQEIADRRVGIEKDKAAALARATEGLLKAGAEVDSDIDVRIKQLEVAREERRKVLQSNYDRDKELFNRIEREALDELAAEAKPHQDNVTADIAKATERRDAHIRAAGIREEIERHAVATGKAETDYQRLSEVLKTLETLRLEKLENLPVPGLVVEDGIVSLDGIPWQNVNLARRVEAVLQICTQLAGSLQLLLVDDCEHLSSDTRAAIEAGLADAGWQVIAAQVTDDPLTIEVVA